MFRDRLPARPRRRCRGALAVLSSLDDVTGTCHLPRPVQRPRISAAAEGGGGSARVMPRQRVRRCWHADPPVSTSLGSPAGTDGLLRGAAAIYGTAGWRDGM